MSLALLLPGALAALAALGIPLLIHLVRRAERRPVDFAALRWIRARQRPQRRLVFEERSLLTVRLLLLALLALVLAEPVLENRLEARDWVVVVPGVDLAAARAQPTPHDADWRWLAPGFPRLDESTPPAPPVASLLRELDARLPPGTRLVVMTPPVLAGLDGERVALGREVDWREVRAAFPAPAIEIVAPPRLAVRHDDDSEIGARYLAASARAWATDDTTRRAPDIAASERLPDADVDTLAWLRPGNVPAQVIEWAQDGRTLVVTPGTKIMDTDTEGEVPALRASDRAVRATSEALGDGRLIRMQQPLHPDAMPDLLDPGFPARLRALLQAPPAPAAAPAMTQRPRRAAAGSSGEYLADVRPLRSWLALLVVLLLLVERILATRTRRWLS